MKLTVLSPVRNNRTGADVRLKGIEAESNDLL